jgi:hypothetical protein
MYLYEMFDLYDEERINVQDVLVSLIDDRIKLEEERLEEDCKGSQCRHWNLMDELEWLKKVFEGKEAY